MLPEGFPFISLIKTSNVGEFYMEEVQVISFYGETLMDNQLL